MTTVEYDQVQSGPFIWIDVRTPGEYNEATIPGAFNFPILSDEERKEVSIIYRNESKQKAKYKGLCYAQNKLSQYYQEIYNIQKEKQQEVIFFCFRGGMRSQSLASVMKLMGIPCYVLSGGYKAYRKHVLSSLCSPAFYDSKSFVVIHGKTGTGKTKILKEIARRGGHILDLEEHAKNKGSIFGAIPFAKQRVNQKYFESLIYQDLIKSDSPIFLESESKKVGQNIIPDQLFKAMEGAKHVLVDCSMEKRIENILLDYPINDRSIKFYTDIIMRMDAFSKEQRKKLCQGLIEGHEKQVVSDLMRQYYDLLYLHSIDKYTYDLTLSSEDIEDGAQILMNRYGGVLHEAKL